MTSHQMVQTGWEHLPFVACHQHAVLVMFEPYSDRGDAAETMVVRALLHGSDCNESGLIEGPAIITSELSWAQLVALKNVWMC